MIFGMDVEIEIASTFSAIEAQAWNQLTDGSPILSHSLFSTLESTGCIGADSGWQPYPIIVKKQGVLVGTMPLFLKMHSYGEYVFDWSWADAHERHQISYYPKLLAAIPFTPISGPRLLTADDEVRQLMVKVMAQQMRQHGLSSAHVLFTDETDSAALQNQGWLQRTGVQFCWENEAYESFEQFLGCLSHDKRKKIHQERKKITQAGVTIRRLLGSEAQAADWDFFHECYRNTYRQHHSTPYLNADFFHEIARQLGDNILLVIAEQHGQPIAAAFNFFDERALYGRYWGALAYVPGLHFELCYYQAQEFCIARGIRYFEGGAQGEHKLARGFKPKTTRSFHLLSHPDFDRAIRDYLRREAHGIEAYHDELVERAPFKQLEISLLKI